MIFDARFIKRHRTRAALPILVIPSRSSSLTPASSRPLFSLLSNPNQTIAAPLFCPHDNEESVTLLASSGDFWCVENGGSLFLWNPSMGAYKRLPSPAVQQSMNYSIVNFFSFGMGYDSVSDDYKILRIPIFRNHYYHETELYSLRSRTWRSIQPLRIQSFPLKQQHITPWKGVFVSGAFHWVALSSNCDRVIVSFDLTTEMFAEVERPPSYLPVNLNKMELTILRENLCIGLNYCSRNRFVLWEMQKYGDPKSWTKMFEIDVQVFIPYAQWNGRYNHHGGTRFIFVTPLFFYDNGMLLIEVTKAGVRDSTIFMYIDEQSEPQVVFHNSDDVGPLYVESLISPATYCGP